MVYILIGIAALVLFSALKSQAEIKETAVEGAVQETTTTLAGNQTVTTQTTTTTSNQPTKSNITMPPKPFLAGNQPVNNAGDGSYTDKPSPTKGTLSGGKGSFTFNSPFWQGTFTFGKGPKGIL